MSGSRNGLVSPESDQQVLSELSHLVQAIREQTKAINNLAVGNQQVIALLTEVVSSMDDDYQEEEVPTYLDSSPRN